MGRSCGVFFNAATIADNNIDMMRKMFNKLHGFVFADKGFISKKAFDEFIKKD